MKNNFQKAFMQFRKGFFMVLVSMTIIVLGLFSFRAQDPSETSEYPFLHLNKTPDVLSKFFKPISAKPNLVFIVVESLGRSYSGPNASQGDFTPFLDSLMPHSLYWENFLSGAGRTFGVVPSLFGSCPFAENGFLDMGDKMPSHLSLINILRQSGYYTSFYYGSEANFDNMEMFIKKDSIDRIIQKKDFGTGYEKMPANKEGFSWGYGDKDLFRKMLEVNTPVIDKPRLDILLTLSNHSPYLIQDQKYCTDKAAAMLRKMPFKEEKKKDLTQYLQYYSTVLYSDDAIRGFINAYKKRPEYANTIFIITGDHRMPEIPIITKIDRFHVPFMIFSPLIKTPRSFKSISTHLDVTPSLMAFLNRIPGIKKPKYVSWVGSGIDTFKAFRNVHSVAMMPYKGSLSEYLDGLYFLSGEQLFDIYPSMDIEPTTNEAKKASLKGMLNAFALKNKKACTNNKLYPDSLLKIR